MSETTSTTSTAASAQGVWAGPCSWPVSYALCPEDDGALATLSLDDQQLMEHMAVEYLWNWTGQKFGLCETTFRPCRSDCYNAAVPTVDWPRTRAEARAGTWGPVLISGQWFNLGCGVCGVSCRCDGGAKQLKLPGSVYSVTSVTIDGVELPASAYEFRGGSILMRIDGEPWPSCQNLSLPLTEADTWSITVETGLPVPQSGQVAAGLLAEEFAKALCRDKRCALPQRWQTITRQGITVTSQDLFEDLEKGHTGIWLIDAWVASIKAPRRYVSSVKSPDYRSGFRRV